VLFAIFLFCIYYFLDVDAKVGKSTHLAAQIYYILLNKQCFLRKKTVFRLFFDRILYLCHIKFIFSE